MCTKITLTLKRRKSEELYKNVNKFEDKNNRILDSMCFRVCNCFIFLYKYIKISRYPRYLRGMYLNIIYHNIIILPSNNAQSKSVCWKWVSLIINKFMAMNITIWRGQLPNGVHVKKANCCSGSVATLSAE